MVVNIRGNERWIFESLPTEKFEIEGAPRAAFCDFCDFVVVVVAAFALYFVRVGNPTLKFLKHDFFLPSLLSGGNPAQLEHWVEIMYHQFCISIVFHSISSAHKEVDHQLSHFVDLGTAKYNSPSHIKTSPS